MLKEHLHSSGSEEIDLLELNATKLNMLPNLKVLYQLLLTHPVTSCESERSFSCIRLKVLLINFINLKAALQIYNYNVSQIQKLFK